MGENYQFILYDVADGIASITLNRPPVNVIDETMTLEYFDAVTRADGDDAVKVIVLSGKGKGLSAGVDIRYLEEFGTEEMARFLEMFYVEQVERVRGLSKPIIAAVHGSPVKAPAPWPSPATWSSPPTMHPSAIPASRTSPPRPACMCGTFSGCWAECGRRSRS